MKNRKLSAEIFKKFGKPERFRILPALIMIEGRKPGHGGYLPGKGGARLLFFLTMSCPEDEKSFAGELYQKYKRFLYARAYEILRNREDAEDAVETAMLGVLRHIGRFRGAPETDVLCQLSIYIRNASIGILRKKRRQAAREQSYSEETVRESVSVLPDTSPLPEERLLDREAVERAEAVLAELPSPVRDAVMLVCFYRYSVVDAAQVLGVTPNAVSLRLYKARKQILEKLEGLT